MKTHPELNKLVKRLRLEEWSMGNGQCDRCHGMRPDTSWATHPCSPFGMKSCGHEHRCQTARVLQESGYEVVYRSDQKLVKAKEKAVRDREMELLWAIMQLKDGLCTPEQAAAYREEFKHPLQTYANEYAGQEHYGPFPKVEYDMAPDWKWMPREESNKAWLALADEIESQGGEYNAAQAQTIRDNILLKV